MSDLNSTVLYESLKSTQTMRDMPRFGHGSDFSKFFAEDQSEAKDYTVGLLVGGIIIVSFFVAWTAVLMVLACLGPEKVGFLSGAPFQKTKREKRPRRCRIVFLISGVVLIVFGVLLVTEGVTNVRETVVVADDSTSDVALLVQDASDVANALQSIGESTKQVRDQLGSLRGNFCPNVDVTEINGYDFDEMAGQAIDLLSELNNFLENDLVDLQKSLEDARQGTKDAEEFVQNISINDWQALIILIPIIIVPSVLMVSVLMAWNEVENPKFTCLVNWCFLPLFMLIAIGAFVGSGGVAITATANADWCSGTSDLSAIPNSRSPDNTILQILDERGLDRQELVFRAIHYYVAQCQTPDAPFEIVTEYKDQIATAEEQVLILLNAFDDVSVPRLTLICGRDYNPISEMVNQISNDLGILFESAKAVLDLLRCSRIVPIYTRAVYDGTCTHSIAGFTWIFASCLVIAFCAFLMLTFRSTLYDTESEEPSAQVAEVYEEQDVKDMSYSHDSPPPWTRTMSSESPYSTPRRTSSFSSESDVYVER